MSVTIVIPTHNDSEVLGYAIESALSQTVPPLEVIVIDDGSTRRPVIPYTEVSDAGGRSVTGVPVLREFRVTNRGLAAARNTGLMLARGEGLIPLDADDTLAPEYIEKTLPLLEGGADVVLTGLQEHGPERNGTYMPGYDKPFNLVTLADMWAMNRFYYACLFRTSMLREVGGWNPLMAGPWNKGGGLEDWDLTLDLMTRGVEYACVNEVLLHYSTANPNSMIHRSLPHREALMAEMKRHHGVS